MNLFGTGVSRFQTAGVCIESKAMTKPDCQSNTVLNETTPTSCRVRVRGCGCAPARRKGRPAGRARSEVVFLLAVLAVSALGANAWCGTVYLNNGDRISGNVLYVTGDEIQIETGYAGLLHIALDEIGGITTTSMVAVRLADGTVLEGRLVYGEGGQTMVCKDGPHRFAPSTISAMAPSIDALDDEADSVDAQEPEPKKWKGTVDVGTAFASGVTDTLDANTEVELVRETGKHTITLTLGGAYGEVESEVDTRRMQAAAKWQYHCKERWYLFGDTVAEHDPGRRLELRAGIGAGFGYEAIKNDKRTLAFEAGGDYARAYWNLYALGELDDAREGWHAAIRARLVSYLREVVFGKPFGAWTSGDWIRGLELALDGFTGEVEQETTSENNISLRLAAMYEQTLFKKSTLTDKLTLLPEVDDFGELRAINDLAFETPISDKLGLRLRLKTEYETDIFLGDDQFNNTFTTSLRYSF